MKPNRSQREEGLVDELTRHITNLIGNNPETNTLRISVLNVLGTKQVSNRVIQKVIEMFSRYGGWNVSREVEENSLVLKLER